MPTYSYACTECGHAFEQFQSFTDDALTECPECAGRLRKLYNAVGVVFKGSGFYRNDSRSPAASESSSESSSAGAKGDSGSTKTTTGSGSSDAKSGSGSAPKKEASGSSGSSSKGSTAAG